MTDLKHTELIYLPGIGPARAKVLSDELHLSTWHDLLYYFPYKHIDRSRFYRIAELTTDMPFVQVKGVFLSFEEQGAGRKSRLVGHFTDGHHLMDAVWFNSIRYVTSSLKINKPYVLFGRPAMFGGRITVSHPDVDALEDFTQGGVKMQPYYSVSEKMRRRGLSSRSLEHFTGTLFQLLKEPVPETLPEYLIKQYRLIPLDQALRFAHYPDTAAHLSSAMMRLKFEELFFLQLSILSYTRERLVRLRGIVFSRVGSLFNLFYTEYLPFSLTDAQKRVIREMRTDMGSGRQMNRLLQGDVGSGKTLVALMIMLLALDNGCQACIMAPTEILARQHLDTFRAFLRDMPVRVELLTGTVKGKMRTAILEDLRQGTIQILVGTHALIEDGVEFANLGLVVIDEQHRFGVAQRARLWKKNRMPPHVLVMTATPIPRTLAMTLYGDLDVSVIDQLPPGRKPVSTVHLYDDRRNDLYQLVHKQLMAGRQVYFVYPLVKESEKIDLNNVEEGYVQLQKAFPDFPVGMVHGQMKPSDKDEQMQRFVSGETRILVSTTVIEVGVNVPNATVMVIQNAERFGLSQLHQLRGRVGRGAEQSYCILVTRIGLSRDTLLRIRVMTETCDGFEIAEADLKFRGPGDLEGTQQSGVAFDLKVSNLAKDGQLVQLARDAARSVLDADPERSDPQNILLWQHLREMKGNRPDWSLIS